MYKFPVQVTGKAMYDDHQSSSYDTEHCSWSNIPDEDFANADDNKWTMGQFVWTGFDYLGEPSPYDTDAWPSHSSLFGIIDLASIPKDRYYPYRSQWNKNDHTLHILPHWTWPGREGQVTPVMVYTDYPEAELFINGKSQGRQKKLTAAEAAASDDKMAPAATLQTYVDRCRVPARRNNCGGIRQRWQKAAESTVRTAGKPHTLKLECSRDSLSANGEDLAYITVSVVDKTAISAPPTRAKYVSK